MGDTTSSQKKRALEVLPAGRLRDLVEAFDLPVDDRRSRAASIGALADGRRVDFGLVLDKLKRAELQAMCDALGLDRGGREKGVLVARILGQDPPPSSTRAGPPPSRRTPKPPVQANPGPAPMFTAITTPPSTRSVLGVLPKARLVDLGRDLGITVTPTATKDEQVELLAASGLVGFRSLMGLRATSSRPSTAPMASTIAVVPAPSSRRACLMRTSYPVTRPGRATS